MGTKQPRIVRSTSRHDKKRYDWGEGVEMISNMDIEQGVNGLWIGYEGCLAWQLSCLEGHDISAGCLISLICLTFVNSHQDCLTFELHEPTYSFLPPPASPLFSSFLASSFASYPSTQSLTPPSSAEMSSVSLSSSSLTPCLEATVI
jgi:hypothetical protein